MTVFRSVAVAVAVAVALIPPPAAARSDLSGRRVIPTIVRKAIPAVVSITTRRIEQNQFNQSVPTRGLGSGFIVDPRGYILTNLHVVEDANEIKVALADGRRFPASLVGTDRFTELAVLKIEGARLPALALGEPRRLEVGETVIAIGNPLWIEGGPTVTVGIVSALGRSMEEEGLPVLHNLIQTDAAINPGNSGGPLLDLDGRVVGINTALIPSAHGIGFAVSAVTARPVLRALIATGRVVRPSIGVYAVSVTPQVAYANDLPMERGALIIRTDGRGPAEAAGLKSGDVITGVDGRPVTDLHHFHDLLSAHKAGQTVTVSVWRNGDAPTVRVRLEELR
ncbi:MAG: S1C family serine protease [bacterium]